MTFEKALEAVVRELFGNVTPRINTNTVITVSMARRALALMAEAELAGD